MTKSVLVMLDVKSGQLCAFPPGLSTAGLAGNLYRKGWAQEYLYDSCIPTLPTDDPITKMCQ